MDAADAVTFALAVLGYAPLTLSLAAALLRGGLTRHRATLARATALVVTAHVACVWSSRFAWDPSLAVGKGIPVFASFHLALLLTWAFALRPRASGRARLLPLAAWILVAPSASYAPFRYEFLGVLAIPVLLVTALGLLVLGMAWRGRRAAAAT